MIRIADDHWHWNDWGHSATFELDCQWDTHTQTQRNGKQKFQNFNVWLTPLEVCITTVVWPGPGPWPPMARHTSMILLVAVLVTVKSVKTYPDSGVA